jgi:hypothetical protein
MRISHEEARRLVLESTPIELWELGIALNAEDPPFAEGVSARLVRDMLEVGEVETWDRLTRAIEKGEEVFRPHVVMPKDDGKQYRSWLPEDLTDGDEGTVRTFIEQSKNPFVRARVFEILWSKFGSFPDANAAIEARFASAALCDAEEGWPRLVTNLGRLATLVVSVNAKGCLERLGATLDDAANQLAGGSRPFSFPVLAEMVYSTLLAKKATREAFTIERGKRWGDMLARAADRYKGDPLHGHDALVVLQAWQGRWGDENSMKATRRHIVEHLRDIGRNAEPMLAPSLYDRALQAALDFGMPDQSEAVRLELMESIKAATPVFTKISGTFNLPADALAQVDKVLASDPQLPAGLRRLSMLPGLFEVDSADLRANVEKQLKDHPLLALVPSVQYHHDGKITFRSNDVEGNVERHAAFLIDAHLVLVEAILAYVLRQAIPRMEPTTLVEALAAWPHLAEQRGKLLSVASERFAKGDYVSSGFIVIPLYEAVLRDLLRAGGYAALKVETGGVQMDETLNSLTRGAPARSILGAGHCDLVEYVMCDPALGWNLRNEIAHGTIRPESLTPMRVLLAWLLLVRLTCFVAEHRNVGGS